MFYELSVVTKSEVSDDTVKKVQKMVEDVVSEGKGKIHLTDDWGSLTLAQPMNNGTRTGRFLYFMYESDGKANTELNRRFKISEDVMKYMTIKLTDREDEGMKLVKEFKCPYSKQYRGSVTDQDENDSEGGDKDRKRFSRRKSCWFSARGIKADWKDPATFAWLVNEFGKISPARVSSISRKHQRFATTAIKRARQIGIGSYLSGKTAQKY